ncbi:DUF2249 domain-containing protein [Pedobacter nyackensis]|uniref:DUF2249 domain-containing protein n=1 Tax=Pedobacter nyackensis TaxID=475255 RepID=UPI00292FBA7E|nr:DUF2249 domain-containing protein [Pedobacter nyackensis]
MRIDLNTRIKVLLDADMKGVMDSLIKLNSNFSKLRNPVLRKLLASRITIAEACKIGGCSQQDFFNNMRAIGFVIDEDVAVSETANENAIDFIRQTIVYELDVRPFLSRNEDPLKEILRLAKKIGIGERMKIINSFEPVPLIHLLAEKGFLVFSETVSDKLVITWFEKTRSELCVTRSTEEVAAEVPSKLFDKVMSRFRQNKIKYLDVRELEMPQPMLRILSVIENLKTDELLYVYHKKLPVYLLPELKKKGLIYLLNPKENHEVDIIIYR